LSQLDSPADKIVILEKGQSPYTDSSHTTTYAGMNFDPGQWNWAGYLAPVNNVPTLPSQHLELQYDFDCALTSTDASCASWGTTPGNMPRFRHTKTCNSLFADGHAKAVVRGQMDWYKNIYVQGPYEALDGAMY